MNNKDIAESKGNKNTTTGDYYNVYSYMIISILGGGGECGGRSLKRLLDVVGPYKYRLDIKVHVKSL